MADRQEDLELQDSDATQIVGGVKKRHKASKNVPGVVSGGIESTSTPGTPSPLGPEQQDSYMDSPDPY